MRRFCVAVILMAGLVGLTSLHAETIHGKARTRDYIVLFAKHFEIDQETQRPIGDTGRCVVIKKGTSYNGWKLDEDRFRYHVGLYGNQEERDGDWPGPVGKVLADCTQLPLLGEGFAHIFGFWEREHSKGAKSVDVEFKSDGDIVFHTHTE